MYNSKCYYEIKYLKKEHFTNVMTVNFQDQLYNIIRDYTFNDGIYNNAGNSYSLSISNDIIQNTTELKVNDM